MGLSSVRLEFYLQGRTNGDSRLRLLKVRIKEICLVQDQYKHNILKKTLWKPRRTYETSVVNFLRIHVLISVFISAYFFLFDYSRIMIGKLVSVVLNLSIIVYNSLV